MALQDQNLAELHERARELGLEGYRMLSRDDLVAAIESREGEPADSGSGPGAGPGDDSEEERRPRRRRRRGRRGGRGRGTPSGPGQGREDDESAAEPADREDRSAGRSREDERPPDDEEAETEDVSGVLDRMPQGYGFLRLSEEGDAEDDDVYVSASQIRRCELRAGDQVSGPARPPRRGERHRALVRVESVNGQEPEGERVQFEDLTAVAPSRRLPLGEGEPLARAVDALAPLAYGQRVLIVAQPRSGRTTLLRAIGRTLAEGDAELRILLADERPEEVTEWERALPDAEIVAAPADQEPGDQVRTIELAMGHAKRRAEAGEDVVVIIDGLSRLALGYRDPARVKRLFGAGRELADEGSGSLTVIATVLDSDDRGKEVREALQTTENVLIRLDADLAALGIVPSLAVAECRVSGEEALRSPEELEAARALRAELAAMDPAEAARELGERIASTKSNAELLGT